MFVGVDEGVYYIDQNGSGIKISSKDVPLVCPITESLPPTVFAAPLHPIKDNVTGMAFNFYNNVWDTNYVLWYPYKKMDGDFRARFSIDFIQNDESVQHKMRKMK